MSPREPFPETPRSEPEILPPERGAAPRGPRVQAFEWNEFSSDGVRQVFVRKIGPFRLFVWAFAALLFVATLLFLFAGALLIAIPLIAALAGGSLIAARLRRAFGR